MRAIGYIRAVPGERDEAQRTAIAEACEQRGWELADVLVDRSTGTKGSNRPALEEALSRVGPARDGAEALVVATLDRVARSFPDYAALTHLFDPRRPPPASGNPAAAPPPPCPPVTAIEPPACACPGVRYRVGLELRWPHYHR